MKLKLRHLYLLPLLAACAIGCSSGQNAAKFSGKVTYNGSTLPGGSLRLHPKAAGAVGSDIGIDGNGRFEASDLPTGDFTVTIETESLNSGGQQPKEYSGGGGAAGGDPKYGPPGAGGGGGGGGNKSGQKAQMSPKPDNAPSQSTSYVKIPAKYNNPAQSGLEVTLKGGSNSKDFDLKD